MALIDDAAPLAPSPAGAAARTGVRVADVLRDIVRGGLAGAIAGIVVGGIGGRIAMRLAAIVDPSALGATTENGNRIGDITLSGTIAVLLFGGLLSGAFAAVVWVVVSPWLPARGVRRALLMFPVAIALGGFFLVEVDNRDFRILDPAGPIALMLVVLVGLLGSAIALVDDALERRLPRAGAHPLPQIAGYGAIALFAAVFIAPAAIGQYFLRDLCFCEHPPSEVGWPLALVGLATAAWWADRVRSGSRRRPQALLVGARVALGIAVVLGLLRLAEEISAIVAR